LFSADKLARRSNRTRASSAPPVNVKRRLLRTRLDIAQPVFQAAHQRGLGAPGEVAVDPRADGLDIGHFQFGGLGDDLPDGGVVALKVVIEEVLDFELYSSLPINSM